MSFYFFPSLKYIKNKKLSPFFILVIAAVIFMCTTIMTFTKLYERQNLIISAVEENALWASYQLDKEALKLRNILKLLDDDFSEDRLKEAKLRFDILYSRVNILEKSKLNVFFYRMSDWNESLIYFHEKLKYMDGLLFVEAVKSNVDILSKESALLLDKTERLVLDVLALRSAEKVKHRNDSLDLFIYLTTLISLLTVTMGIIVFMLFKQLKVVNKSYGKSIKLTKELNIAVNLSKLSLKAKSDFVATMSHEIRTPMNAIVGFSYLLIDSDLTESDRDKVNKIQKAAINLLGIINGILDFSKIESGKIDLEKSSFNLDDTLEYVYQINDSSAKNKGLNFTISRDFSMPDYLIGDQARLQQILINLVSNAIKFTHSGSVAVRVYENGENEFVIEVRDTGVGIRSGVDIFDVFQQADSSTTRRYGGTGLGLSIVQKIVALLNGHISYESEENEGSQFLVVLPYCPDLTIASYIFENVALISEDVSTSKLLNEMNFYNYTECKLENIVGCNVPFLVSRDFSTRIDDFKEIQKRVFKESALFLDGGSDCKFYSSGLFTPTNMREKLKVFSSNSRNVHIVGFQESKKIDSFTLKGKKVLLAEDNRINADIVIAIVNKMGASVDWVENGREAYEKAITNCYDLILMDIHMPVMDGYKASEKIHYALNKKKPPILVLTADSLNLNVDDFTSFYFNDALFKPLDPYLLIKKVKYWIERYNKDLIVGHPNEKESTFKLLLDLEALKDMLIEGDSSSNVYIKNIIENHSDYSGTHFLIEILSDIDSYDYNDALLKVESLKKYIFI
ncbi:ATP-binding protein [Marinomonas primoryensis]|uniref:ATP-binding protein n=1 Tax=Marinomonas primoryensis TaxID=178399 RepID=UPI0037048CFF